MDKITEVGHKMRSAIKAKLIELGCYVDDELPDYIMVMVANHRSKEMMLEDLQLFLDSNTTIFVNWLHHVLQKLHEVTVSSIDIPKITKQEARLKRKIVESKTIKINESLMNDELKTSTSTPKHDVKIKTMKIENKSTPSLTDDLPILSKSIVEQRRISLKTKQQEPEKETIVPENNQLELVEIENKILEAQTKLAELEKNDNEKNVIDDEEFINIAAHDDELQFDDDKDDGCLTPPLLDHHQIQEPIKVQKKLSILDRLGDKKQLKPITSVATSSSNDKKIRLSEIKKIENELLYGSASTKNTHASSNQTNSKRELKRKTNVHERIGIMSSIVKPINNNNNNNNKRRRREHNDNDDVDKDVDTTATSTLSSVVKITSRNAKLSKNKIQPNTNLLLKAMAAAHKSISISNINNNNKTTTNTSTTSAPTITTTSTSERKNINNKRVLNDTSNENKNKKKELYTSHFNKNKNENKTDNNKKLIQNIIIKVNTSTNSNNNIKNDDLDKNNDKDIQDEEEEAEVEAAEEEEEEEQLILPTSTTNDHAQERAEHKQRFIVTLNGVDENKIFNKSFKTKSNKNEKDKLITTTTTNDNDNDNDNTEEKHNIKTNADVDMKVHKKIEKKKRKPPSPITFNENDFNNKTNALSIHPTTTTTTPSTTILKKQHKSDERDHCKYWPRCKLKDGQCEYRHDHIPSTLPPVVVNHPSQQRCKTFPLCKYGQHCYYLHPLCKFNLQCTSLNCIYKHSNRTTIQAKMPPSIASTVVAVPVSVTVPIQVNNKICKYYPKCTNVQCKYIHKKQLSTSIPIPCRYGQYCLNQYECNYDHSISSTSSSRIISSSSSSMIPNKYKLKWKSSL